MNLLIRPNNCVVAVYIDADRMEAKFNEGVLTAQAPELPGAGPSV